LLLNVPNRIPAKTSDDNKNTDTLIPNAGTANPEININPNAEPARSALYTAEGIDDPCLSVVRSRKRWPVIKAGRNADTIIKINPGTSLWIVIILLYIKPIQM
jgi:hypothetical protein